MSPWLTGVLATYAAFLLAVASPGPNVLAVMGTSMNEGRRAGTALALGIAAGSLCWSSLSVLGLSAVLATYAAAMTAIKVVGGLYLVWLGIKAFRSALSAGDPVVGASSAAPGKTLVGYALRGYLVMMTNPKAVFAWIAIVSLGMGDGAPMWVPIAIVLGTFALSVLAHVGYAIGFSAPAVRRLYVRSRRWVQTAFGTFFVLAGGRLLTDRS